MTNLLERKHTEKGSNYWNDSGVYWNEYSKLWDVEHQMRQINHDRIDFGQEQVKLTDDDKNAILDRIEDNFDANYGIAWDSIESAIIDYLDEIEDEIETRFI